MKQHSALWCCAVALLMMAALRLSGTEAIPLLVFSQTGRLPLETAAPTTPGEPSAPTNFTSPTQITQPTEREETPEAVLSFSADTLFLVKIRYSCDYRPALAPLLEAPLDWDLTGDSPTVLIIHTHATEGYSGVYEEWTRFRTTDEANNMVAIGQEVARVLEMGGITVLHDRTLHDYPNYSNSYNAARDTIRSYLEQYPSIRMVLDLHRDASDDYDDPMTTTATVGGQSSSQLMFVAGTDGSGLYYPNWTENLSLALKLTVLLEQENPGISRGIVLRNQRFNLDLTAGSLLVEVGAMGDTQQEALLAANALAHAILKLAGGSE